MTQISLTPQQYQFKKQVLKKKNIPSKSTPLQLHKSVQIQTEDMNEIHTIKYIKIENQKHVVYNELLIKEIFLGSEKFVPLLENKNPTTGHISKNSNLLKKVGSIMTLPAIFTQSYALAKEQVHKDMVNDVKSLSAFALLSSVFSSVFNFSFLAILFFIFVLAILEYILSLMKRFRLNGVDYAPIAKAQILLGSFIFFLAASFMQVGVNYLIKTQLGATPEWLSVAKQYVNLSNTTALFILGFYMNTIRKMYSKATGAKEEAETANVSG